VARHYRENGEIKEVQWNLPEPKLEPTTNTTTTTTTVANNVGFAL